MLVRVDEREILAVHAALACRHPLQAARQSRRHVEPVRRRRRTRGRMGVNANEKTLCGSSVGEWASLVSWYLAMEPQHRTATRARFSPSSTSRSQDGTQTHRSMRTQSAPRTCMSPCPYLPAFPKESVWSQMPSGTYVKVSKPRWGCWGKPAGVNGDGSAMWCWRCGCFDDQPSEPAD